MYKKVIQKGLIILLIILLGLLIYLIKLSYKENELISTGSTTTKIDTTSSTTSTVTTTTTSTTTTTTKAIELSDSIYAPYHIENYDNYSIDNITDADIQRVFTEKGAVVCGDSMAEGLTAYGVLSNNNVVWHRGRRIDNMDKDLDKIKELKPNYLFLAYGSNDLDLPVSIKKTNSDAAFSYQAEFNNALRDLANSYGITFLENSPFLSGKDKPYSSDGVHPKSFYYSLWAKHMTSYLETL